ncbi:hypothetical protein GFM01_22585 [Rhizobium laguerreae]|uniref:hypothetical protein n=1 Tax=Rhizobium laguerreae TaxID=1076926 RepID=UPI001440F177|nr:hypothetical protein [Rhizobium laguerreae]NKM20557.1 hypothetical protein [Rhizobium laguerreae]
MRLFLTVDLVGSTAFKAKALKGGDKLYPEWVSRFREFYRQFPELLDVAFRDTKTGRTGARGPKLWKIIGDEILFCCRITNLQQLSCCVTAFITALEQYALSLANIGLDVKGAGWLADFPAKNITLSISDGAIEFNLRNEDLPTEEFEAEADGRPHNFDFLGSAIDTGFRVAKHADADKFAASAELALLLSDAKERQMFMREFRYEGRLSLKGINGEHPYPVVFVDTERDPRKREIRIRERLVTGEGTIEPVALRDFIKAYLTCHGFELPILPLTETDEAGQSSASYEQYRKQWQRDLEAAQKQDESIQAAETAGADDDKTALTTLVTDFALSKQADAMRKSQAFLSAVGGIDKHLTEQQIAAARKALEDRMRRNWMTRRQRIRPKGKPDDEER